METFDFMWVEWSRNLITSVEDPAFTEEVIQKSFQHPSNPSWGRIAIILAQINELQEVHCSDEIH